MSDELTQAPDEIQDTPAADAAPEGTPADTETSEVNWEKRFNDLQPALTKAQQENARLRAIDEGLRNPERAAEILQQYGFSVGDDEPEEDEELEGPRDPRLDSLLAEREQEKQQREATENWNRFTTDLDKLAKDKGTTLNDRERSMVYMETLQAGGTPDALASVFGDYLKEREAAEKAAVARYIESKKNAPFVSPGGTGANQVTDPLDGKARRERLAARLDANDF